MSYLLFVKRSKIAQDEKRGIHIASYERKRSPERQRLIQPYAESFFEAFVGYIWPTAISEVKR